MNESLVDATVIIPTFNRSDALLETLDALARMDYPSDRWEAVVIDDGSTDDTSVVVEQWIARTGASVRYLRQSNAGPAAARNRGASEAKSKYLIFIDNDIIVERDFVSAHLETLARNPGCWVVGRVVHPEQIRSTPFGRYRDSVWEAFHHSHDEVRVSETTGITAANLSLPAKDFEMLGGFDADFTIASSEDWVLGMRARQTGIRVLYHPGIVVLHNDWALSLERFCERQRLYSISDVLLWRKYGETSPRSRLVREHAPVAWGVDPPRLILKKAIKRILATNTGQLLVRTACTLAERVAPDTNLSRRAYTTAVAVAIFRGVREGLQRYASPSLGTQASRPHDRIDMTTASGTRALPGQVPHGVCHLIDRNLDTNYFRSIARCHDRERFPAMIGSIAPGGPLQEAMLNLSTPTFSLGAGARWQYPLVILRLVRLLKRGRVAVLHAHCFDPTFVGLIAARLARVSFVFTRHHSDHNIRLDARWHTRIDAWCGRHADHVIAVSEATRQIMIEVERVPGRQITVIYNGMEPLREPEPSGVARLRQEFDLSREHVCLMLARLHEEKGHRYLFEAIPEITSRVGSVVFLLAGDGPQRGEFEAEVRARGLQNTVRFLGRRDDVSELISLSSLVVLPSLAESFGFTLLEAMSLAKPVVASTTGGIPEVAPHGETGLLVPPADSRALANAICDILENPERAQAFGEAGRRRATQFTFERMMGGYERVYQKVIERRIENEYGEQPAPSAKREGNLS
jgi:glycosyltransferase involved in cell wall biosynthesis/GT2 family glycosyltransferase